MSSPCLQPCLPGNSYLLVAPCLRLAQSRAGGLWDVAAESLAQTLVKPLMKQMPETEAPRKEKDSARAA